GLVRSLMEQGRLVTLVPDNIPSPRGFYLKIHPRAGSKAWLFASWLAKSS
ncbi:MAG: LysR family transcriptional regulator, partial [Mesorhizobium sp.]